MPPSRATLNQPVNLNSANALYNHAASTSAVHGLPATAHVLGDTTAGRFTQTGQTTISNGTPNTHGGYSYPGVVMTYPVAYTTTPIAVGGGGGSYGGQFAIAATAICDVTTTTLMCNHVGFMNMYMPGTPASWMVVGK